MDKIVVTCRYCDSQFYSKDPFYNVCSDRCLLLDWSELREKGSQLDMVFESKEEEDQERNDLWQK